MSTGTGKLAFDPHRRRHHFLFPVRIICSSPVRFFGRIRTVCSSSVMVIWSTGTAAAGTYIELVTVVCLLSLCTDHVYDLNKITVSELLGRVVGRCLLQYIFLGHFREVCVRIPLCITRLVYRQVLSAVE